MTWCRSLFRLRQRDVFTMQRAGMASLTSTENPSLSLTNAEASARRLSLFEKERERQNRLITDTTKIKVYYTDLPEPCTLLMNKNQSTPFDCSKHVSEWIGERAVLASVDGDVWDMHRPLVGDVESLKFLHFQEADPYFANKAFWRSCSLMLGSVLETVFKQQYYVQLCSFPAPNIRTGSFVYDFHLGHEWNPTKEEMRVLSSEMVKLAMKQLPFERLTISTEVALEMFKDNIFKRKQIPFIAEDDKLTVYRVGNFVDISRGPMMSNTAHLGRVTITAVHSIPSGLNIPPNLLRIQGVALPKCILLNHYAYGILEKRAMKLNDGSPPDLQAIGMVDGSLC